MAQTNETFDNINKSVEDASASLSNITYNSIDFDFDLSNQSDSRADIFLDVVTNQPEPLFSRGCTKIYIEYEAIARVVDSTKGIEWCSVEARGGGAVTWYIFRNNEDMYFIHKHARPSRIKINDATGEITHTNITDPELSDIYSYSRASRDYVHELINAH
jgi:hypothetical protein